MSAFQVYTFYLLNANPKAVESFLHHQPPQTFRFAFAGYICHLQNKSYSDEMMSVLHIYIPFI